MRRRPETLDELAHAIADAAQDDRRRAELAGLVLDLERLAGAELGGIRTDTVVLARRFARVHRLLAGAEPAAALRAWPWPGKDPIAVAGGTRACA
jgi:hypothetical protein